MTDIEVIVEEVTLAGVPALIRRPSQMAAGTAPVLLWHGIGPPGDAKTLMDTFPLDDLKTVKVYLDLPMFGARLPSAGKPELRRRIAEDYPGSIFGPVIIKALQELPSVLDIIAKRWPSMRREVSLFGFGDGGLAALLAVFENFTSIQAVVTLNAPPSLYEAATALERIMELTFHWTEGTRTLAGWADVAGRVEELDLLPTLPALLILHGEKEERFGKRVATNLENVLRPIYHRRGHDPSLVVNILKGIPYHVSPRYNDSPMILKVGDPALFQDVIADWFRPYVEAERV